ncbi:MAG: WYL domain-containing protein [Bacteroidota bacterium]
MPTNRNALIRYKTIDKCLQNRYRKWTLEDLIEACSEALYEYEGIDKGVSRRTVQADIQMMRSDKLGYNAPIIVLDKKYYTYEEPHFSITNIPLSEQDLSKLHETIEFMRQFRGFSHFKELDGMVQKLEDHIYAQKNQSQPVIDFEKNENLKGIEYLDTLYQAIIHSKTLEITYQSFRARQEASITLFPYWLKEFRNRWFVVGMKEGQKDLTNLALDRIMAIEQCDLPYKENVHFDFRTYYQHVIGASVSENLAPIQVLLFVNRRHAPYLLTKPLHHSQEEVSRDAFGITIQLVVQHNFELEKEILSHGENVQVLAPESLKRRIKERLKTNLEKYEGDLNIKGLQVKVMQLEHKGTTLLNHVYTGREANHIKRVLDRKLNEHGQNTYYKRALLREIPDLRHLIFNRNLERILHAVDPEARLTKATFISKEPQSNWYVTWHQDMAINVKARKEVPGYSGWTQKDGITSVLPPEEVSKKTFAVRIHLDHTDGQNGALKVLPGSHKQRLTDEQISLITENSIPNTCEVGAGGIHLMKPLILHASSKLRSQRKRRVIHLEFCSGELEGGLEWSEG